MPVQGIKTVASAQNGVGAFILQCKKLDLHYCDWAGSSKGMNAFLQSPNLTNTIRLFPSTEFRISPRPNRPPVLRATYINGTSKAICVRNLQPLQIQAKMKYLLENSGAKNVKIKGKNVVSQNESVRGVWSALHGGIKDV